MSSVSNPLKYYLSDEEREFFNEHGYLVIKGLVDKATVENVRQRFLDVCNNKISLTGVSVIKDNELKKTKQKPEEYVNKILNLQHDPIFSTQVEHPRLVHVLIQLLGEDLSAINSMVVNKPPGTKWHPPHQDMFHLPLRPFEKVLTTWTACDPVAEDNGCLFVVPGSHKEGVLHPEVLIPNLINNLYFIIPDVDEVAPERKRVSLAPMEPGDTVIMHSLMVHGSWPNRSDKYRKAMTNIYFSNECQYVDVKGTVQEIFEQEIKNEIIKRQAKVNVVGVTEYVNTFKLKHYWMNQAKPVKSSKSHL